ncbi:neugrin isoform X2 [Sinocyclocheilus rhinocerous]|nr:PREDICTED: neugrin-like isoform X2 [Sinocyclocheilus rhinocerous]XP_016372605.1 PREDICTED: neugrin-like isoform X2 [Sinocyclocheilus rhinocerous]XP_016372606.1 PREDICTED: neugrin-like isoform X2 [Sinocyclocheilus rhinocerous]
MGTPWRMAHMLATKLASFPGPAACQVCRHASRHAYGWMSQRYSDSHPRQKQQEDMFEDDHDMDAVEAKLNSIISEERKRRKAAKFHIIKRKMNNPEAPERRLSWDAIQQIRYLKQESPEEWTLQRLAEGFSVSPDVIFRVLRSKYTSSAVRKLKQDSKVLASTGPQSLRDGKTEQTRLPKTAAPAILLSGNTGALTALSTGALAVREAETGLMSSSGNIVPSQLSAEQKVTPALQEQPDCKAEMDTRGDIELEEEWDGVILKEEELEHLAQTLKEKPSPVEQKGKEFFDSEGKFLYRI